MNCAPIKTGQRPVESARSAIALLMTSLLLFAAPVLADSTIGLDETRLGSLADAINKDQDLVSSEQLAQWIIEERRDFVLIDVREEALFQASHIDGASNIPMHKLFDTAQIEALPRQKLIVLYSTADTRAAQAAVMLRLAGLDAYALLGGFEHWALHTLNPQPAAAAAGNRERLDAARREAIARALKKCDMPCPLPEPDPASKAGYLPPLSPVDQPAAKPPASKAGVLLDAGC